MRFGFLNIIYVYILFYLLFVNNAFVFSLSISFPNFQLPKIPTIKFIYLHYLLCSPELWLLLQQLSFLLLRLDFLPTTVLHAKYGWHRRRRDDDKKLSFVLWRNANWYKLPLTMELILGNTRNSPDHMFNCNGNDNVKSTFMIWFTGHRTFKNYFNAVNWILGCDWLTNFMMMMLVAVSKFAASRHSDWLIVATPW